MKCRCIVPAMLGVGLCMVAASNAHAFELLERVLMAGGVAQKGCCAQKADGCAPVQKSGPCQKGAAQKSEPCQKGPAQKACQKGPAQKGDPCQKSCCAPKRKLFAGFSLKRLRPSCCEPACGKGATQKCGPTQKCDPVQKGATQKCGAAQKGAAQK